ncbi:Phosphoribosyl 1,2-cyclic phosphodiesterase [Alkalithermobacter thermoalcaliphilus JW-YL-7 = DSM 7308]|uniref:Beta-lactamase domain protein n=1 Tax=Alkalithermobacter thermoalcaliphilus JW-YL-7 = DSM 7308 TaxID=1121328 RepID=A0A150FSX7_CLOPD|nr:beta-lactamase domain protein [[Clostridium] paradoxum JW-YL-7 = DSM 7308]SHL09857.1 Phosphoribosyl 1,2-cyclic phosphodiesterase [[Clostridium] paradoxum JW-YL-7 = DSM 7308]
MLKYTSIASSSSGNCHYIGYKEKGILVDAGLSGKKIKEGLDKFDIKIENIVAILISHEHTDHIKGAGILSRRYDIPIYANQKTFDAMKEKIGCIHEKNIKIFQTDKKFEIDDIQITPFSIHHDAKDPVAFTFDTGNTKISIATDLGYVCENIKKNVCSSKLVVLESNHDVEMVKMGPYPYSLKKRVLSKKGHLSNEDAGKFALDLVKTGTEKILLAHLSKENNFPDLAFETVNSILKMNNIQVGKDVNLKVLDKDISSNLYAV